MRMKFYLLTIFVSISSIIVFGQGKTSINDKITGEQKGTLEYAKYLLKKNNNKILLPLEVNALLGDTITNEPYKAVPSWDEAYFEKNNDFKASLILPLTAKTIKGNIKATLNIMRDENIQYFRVVNMILNYPEEKDTTSIYISSNIGGIFLHASIFENGKKTGQMEGLVGMNGVCDNTFQSRKIHSDSDRFIENRFFNINVVKQNGSTSAHSMMAKQVKITPGSLLGTPHINEVH